MDRGVSFGSARAAGLVRDCEAATISGRPTVRILCGRGDCSGAPLCGTSILKVALGSGGSLGLTFTSPQAFLERYTGLFQDYEALDRILPAEAVILQGRSRSDERQIAWLSKPPAFYSPRPMLFQSSEVQGEPAYLLYVEGVGSFDPWIPAGYRLGERVYRNEHARFYPNRTPSTVSDMERIAVYRLLRLR